MGGGKNMPPSAIRAFLRMTDVECGVLFTVIGHLTQPGRFSPHAAEARSRGRRENAPRLGRVRLFCRTGLFQVGCRHLFTAIGL